MDFIVRVTILLGIIAICVVLASTTINGAHVPPVIDTFTAESGISSTCTTALVNLAMDIVLSNDTTGRYSSPAAQAQLYGDLSANIDQYLTLEPLSFLQRRGIDTSKIPADVISTLPKIKLIDLVNKFQRNNVLDENGNVIGTNECLIPMSLMKQFRSQTTGSTIQMRDSLVDVSNTSSPLYSPNTKQCKIGKTFTKTNIPKEVTRNNDDFDTVDSADSTKYGLQSFGCVLPTEKLGENDFINMLSEMYSYTDSKTMNTFRNTLNQYAISMDTLSTAATNNLNAFKTLTQTSAQLTAAQTAAKEAEIERKKKEAQTQQSLQTMSKAATAASTNVTALQTKLDLLA
jgi:hypothetical protein